MCDSVSSPRVNRSMGQSQHDNTFFSLSTICFCLSRRNFFPKFPNQQSTYKGGSGPQGETPVPFPGEEVSTQDKQSPEISSSSGGNTPGSAETPGGGGAGTGGAAHGNSNGGGGGGFSGLLDDSMNDPLSLLAALKNPPAPAETSASLSAHNLSGKHSSSSGSGSALSGSTASSSLGLSDITFFSTFSTFVRK